MANDIHHLTDQSSYYPPLLREINQPPVQIYVRGNVDLLSHEPQLAVVGSRRATRYGQQCLKILLPPLIREHVVIVSGLAFGIDSIAHQTCVELQAPTIAVLGSGVDDRSIYPRSHLALARQIIRYGGAIVSEYPPGTPTYPSNFPERNRIIAGLAKATLIAQAAQHSGSLITARLALDFNREVLAIPGPITDPLAWGTNYLIKQGATPITETSDLLEVYGLNKKPEETNAQATPELTDEQKTIWDKLSAEPKHIDHIVAESQLDPSLVGAALVQLELCNLAQNCGQQRYIKKS